MKKLLFSLFTICVFNSCKESRTKKTELCINEILTLETQNNICIIYLNPKTSCWACYYGAINNATKLSSKYNIKIITTSDIAHTKRVDLNVKNKLRLCISADQNVVCKTHRPLCRR